jgi:hypothetical protein
MQKLRILYLDARRDKALQRALNKYGAVFYAQDLNAALFLMAENGFEYYFIDADVPQSQGFLQHLRHDPQLLTPRGVVLLTGNDDEDCEAWGVDTFLTRSTALDDLPYIFSHLKGDRSESATVLRIASFNPDEPVPGADPVKKASRAERMSKEHDVTDEVDAREHLNKRHPARDRDDAIYSAGSPPKAATRTRNARLALVGVLLVAFGVWVFVAGPLSTRASKSKGKASNQKHVDAGAQKKAGADQKYSSSVSGTAPAATTPAAPQSPGPVSPVEASTAAPADTSEQPEVTPSPAPAPAPVNHAPTVSIAGPTQVMRGQPASYSASGSDPDGDSVSLSWTSRTMCWSTPGLYSLSVTASDSRGASGSDSISVRVI